MEERGSEEGCGRGGVKSEWVKRGEEWRRGGVKRGEEWRRGGVKRGEEWRRGGGRGVRSGGEGVKSEE